MKNIKALIPLMILLVAGLALVYFGANNKDISLLNTETVISTEKKANLYNDISGKLEWFGKAEKLDLDKMKKNYDLIFVHFWASWCDPCVEEFPALIDFHKNNFSKNPKIAFIMVSQDKSQSSMKRFLKSFPYKHKNFFLLRDPNSKLADTFGTEVLPESFLVHKTKGLVDRMVGQSKWKKQEYVDRIQKWFPAPEVKASEVIEGSNNKDEEVSAILPPDNLVQPKEVSSPAGLISNDTLKTEQEVDLYLKMYEKSAMYSAFYRNKIKPYVKESIHYFDLKYSGVACLMFRESQWDPRAVSYVGALGLGQIMPATFDFLISAIKRGESKVQKLADEQKRSFADVELPNLLAKEYLGLQRYEYEQKLYMKMAQQWRHYAVSVGLDTNIKNYHNTNYLLSSIPLNVGLSGVYLLYLKHRLFHLIKDSKRAPDNKHFFLAMAGSYNQGFKRLKVGVIKGQIPSEPFYEDWYRKLAKIDETRHYMITIDRCMSKNIYTPPVGKIIPAYSDLL